MLDKINCQVLLGYEHTERQRYLQDPLECIVTLKNRGKFIFKRHGTIDQQWIMPVPLWLMPGVFIALVVFVFGKM